MSLRVRRMFRQRPQQMGRLLLHAMRLLAFALAVQLSGSPHLLADAVFGHEDSWDLGSADPCSDDEDGRQCPPGCPTCHCVHAQVPFTSRIEPPQDLPRLFVPTYGERRDEFPPSPPPRSLFRPPRA